MSELLLMILVLLASAGIMEFWDHKEQIDCWNESDESLEQ